ncbi:MAG: aspartate aminotransferase family protein [Pseudomonadota bacterium]
MEEPSRAVQTFSAKNPDLAESSVLQSEGEVNFSPRRQAWAAERFDEKSRTLLDEDSRLFLHQSLSTPCLSVIEKAEGIWIQDSMGRRYMDFHGNSVHHIGYGHPRLRAAIKTQIDELSFAPRRFTCAPAVELAAKLAAISPGDLGKVLFATGGSDAIEIALKVARAATGRYKTLSFWDSFHGAGFGASSVGGEQLFRGAKIGPLLAGAEHLPPFGCYRSLFGHQHNSLEPHSANCGHGLVELIRYVLEREGDVAALVAEPNRAVPMIPPPGFWAAVRQACDDAGTLLIFDEIPTGLGKTGRFFACDHDGVVPDILVMGKALGGGMLPIAATLCKPELDGAGDYALGHYTHEKNPVTAKAALTTIQIIEDEDLVERAATLGAKAMERLQDMMQRHRLIGDVRGRGLLMGVELVEDRESKTPARDAAEAVFYRALDQGLSFKISMGNVLTLSPPLVIEEKDLMQSLQIIDDSIAGLS